MTPEEIKKRRRFQANLMVLGAVTLSIVLLASIATLVNQYSALINPRSLELVSTILSLIGGILVAIIVPTFLRRRADQTPSEIDNENEVFTNEDKEAYATLKIVSFMLIPLHKNIVNHINGLEKNSIINLVLGILGTIGSVSVLIIALLSERIFPNIQIFLLNFIPRVSFVILLQLFAFFFLRLYKSNLEDVKYFQNELTNILAKSTSIRLAFLQKDITLINALITELSNTERNFKISTGESLLMLEKAKIDRDGDLSHTKLLTEILALVKPGSQTS